MYNNNMWGGYNPLAQNYNNPYQTRLENFQPNQLKKFEIIHVNGENGAKSFRMAPNSQCLLLDDTAPLIWLCQSDGAGYHTVTPYTIAPYQNKEIIDTKSLEARIAKLEAIINEQSNSTGNEQQTVATTTKPTTITE